MTLTLAVLFADTKSVEVLDTEAVSVTVDFFAATIVATIWTLTLEPLAIEPIEQTIVPLWPTAGVVQPLLGLTLTNWAVEGSASVNVTPDAD